MDEWLKISLILSVFGFLKEFRPSEPFIYEFLVGPWRPNITSDMVLEYVYPMGTYSYLAHAVIVFLITDMCRYKPLIVILGLTGILVWSLLLWSTSLFALQVLEVFYGTFMATEVAYYAYIYAKVNDKKHYQTVTSHTRAAILAGRALSSVIGQLMISFKIMDYRQLNYITLSAMIFATIWSIFLPSVQKTIYFHPVHQNSSIPLSPATPHPSPIAYYYNKITKAFALMGTHFTEAFTNRYVLKWSLWFTLATCGFIQVQTYVQPLWRTIEEEKNIKTQNRTNNNNDTSDSTTSNVYNGATEAMLTILGVLAALTAGVLKVNWQKGVKGDLIISLISLISGFLILYTSQTECLLLSYVCYVSFGAFYHFLVTIASGEIAKVISHHNRDISKTNEIAYDNNDTIVNSCDNHDNEENDSFGLVFGINMFVALVFQSVLTMTVVSGATLAPREQYFVYGMFHVGVAGIFIVLGLVNWVCYKKRDDYYLKPVNNY